MELQVHAKKVHVACTCMDICTSTLYAALYAIDLNCICVLDAINQFAI